MKTKMRSHLQLLLPEKQCRLFMNAVPSPSHHRWFLKRVSSLSTPVIQPVEINIFLSNVGNFVEGISEQGPVTVLFC